MEFKDIIKINTIEEYATKLGCPPENHPLVHLCRLTDVRDYIPLGKSVQLNLYSIVMKDGTNCTSKYGWREYDFTKGSMNFFAP